jgi:hypothetical protein
MNTIREITDLADKRLQEAELLHANGMEEGAFYLAGYVIELMLKARICKNLDIENFYIRPIKTGKQAFFTHDLEQLLTLSGLRTIFDQEISTNTVLANSWLVICTWDEERRYVSVVTHRNITTFLSSVKIFLAWFQQNW